MNPAHDNIPKSAPAATVILTREYAGNLQVYLLKRSPKSGFMAGNFVFPGGTLERDDQHSDLFHKCCDLTQNEIATRFGPDLSDDQALAYCIAAVRETLEEAGIFIAHKYEATADDLERIRRLRLTDNLKKDWFVKLVNEEGWRLALSRLSRWSHWITPVLMKRRFDTRFFLTELPAGQVCRPDDRETVKGLWLTPKEALVGNMSGEIPLSPPTLVTLHELLKFRTLTALKIEAESREWGLPIRPRLIPLSVGAVIVEPWDPSYAEEKIIIRPEDLPTSVVPVGQSFSRLWLDQGVWKPVGP